MFKFKSFKSFNLFNAINVFDVLDMYHYEGFIFSLMTIQRKSCKHLIENIYQSYKLQSYETFKKFRLNTIYLLLYFCSGKEGEKYKSESIEILKHFIQWVRNNQREKYIPYDSYSQMIHTKLIEKIIENYDNNNNTHNNCISDSESDVEPDPLSETKLETKNETKLDELDNEKDDKTCVCLEEYIHIGEVMNKTHKQLMVTDIFYIKDNLLHYTSKYKHILYIGTLTFTAIGLSCYYKFYFNNV